MATDSVQPTHLHALRSESCDSTRCAQHCRCAAHVLLHVLNVTIDFQIVPSTVEGQACGGMHSVTAVLAAAEAQRMRLSRGQHVLMGEIHPCRRGRPSGSWRAFHLPSR